MKCAVTIAASLLLVVAAAAGAEDGKTPADDPVAAVRKAWVDFRSKCVTTGDARGYLAGEAAREPRVRFLEAFEKVDWNTWDLASEADLLAEGVSGIAYWALEAKDYARARKGYEFLVERLPVHPETQLSLSFTMPEMYAASGEFAAGIRCMRGTVGKLPHAEAARVLIGIGDLQAASGDFAAARSSFVQAAATIAKYDGDDYPEKGRIDDALARRKLVGTRASEIDASDCVGGKPAKLSSMAGQVVVLFLLQPRATVNLGNVQALEALHRKLGGKGLAVVGATCFESLIARTRTSDSVEVGLPKDVNDGEGTKVTVTRAGFRAHVETFRTRRGITFPILLAGKEQIRAYLESGFHEAVVVVGPDQLVVHVSDVTRTLGACGVAAGLQARLAVAGTGK